MHLLNRRLFLLLSILGLTACTPSPESKALEVFIQRLPCYGPCPAYDISIKPDGTVTYDGNLYVAVEGRHLSEISTEQVNELLAAILEMDIFALEDNYMIGGRDAPLTIITVALDEEVKTIWHPTWQSCNHLGETALRALCELESSIDEIVIASQWTDPQ
jgi:hypothetical protein